MAEVNTFSAASTPPPLGNSALPATLDMPDVIGPYRVLSLLGEGGMGAVYLAEQHHPVRRRVAVKIVKAGMDTREVLSRFNSERQALALMNHPNIASVVDGGATEAGRPYFVMEYVPGIPITEYCDRNRLSIEQRLELFILACQAVQHAHQKGIIHRDLKPSNVLVAAPETAEAQPTLKIIDFGVAKAVNHALLGQSVFTEQGMLIGTPEYMSPEQAELTALDIDTRTDIYSLGVLLYELLTGVLPFDSSTLRKAGYAAIQRIIREVDPPRPSTRLSGLGAASTTILEQRRCDMRSLHRRVRGDLDWIAMKCLEKDRSRRYETASALSSDVRRFLRDEPVLAGPPSGRYVLGKFVRRNRGACIAAGLLILVLVAGAIGTTAGLIRASRARAAAERRFEQVRSLATSFLFDFHEAIADLPGSTPAVELLARQALQSLDGLAADASNDRKLLIDVVQAYHRLSRIQSDQGNPNLGDLPAARQLIDRSDQLIRKIEATWPGDVAIGMLNASSDRRRADLDATEGRSDQAAAGYHRALATYQERLESDPDNIEALLGATSAANGIGDAARAAAKLSDAIDAYRQALAYVKRGAEKHPTPSFRVAVNVALSRIGNILAETGETTQAYEAQREALTGFEQLLRDDPLSARNQRDVAVSCLKVGGLLATMQRTRDSIEYFERGLAMRQSLYDRDPQNVTAMADLATAQMALANAVRRLGQFDKAIEFHTKARDLLRRLVEKSPQDVNRRLDLASAIGAIADVLGNPGLENLGRFEEALPYYEEALRIRKELAGMPDAPPRASVLVARSYEHIGNVLRKLGRYEPARAAFETCLQHFEALQTRTPEDPDVRRGIAISLEKLGELDLETGEYDRALARLDESLQLTRTYVSNDAQNAEGRRDVAVAAYMVGRAFAGAAGADGVTPEQATRYWAGARDRFAEAATILEALESTGQLLESDKPHLKMIRARRDDAARQVAERSPDPQP